jgi:hypothetical protein
LGSGTSWDYATIKYNSEGQQQWVARYNGLGNGFDCAICLVVDGDGFLYVAGYSLGIGTSLDYTTIKYDDVGQQQWVSRYNGPTNGDDEAIGLAVDSVGSVYVTGFSAGNGTNRDYATVKYDAFGQQQWVARYNGPGNGDDEASSLAIDEDLNVFVTGQSYGNGTGYRDYATIKYNSAGQEQWVIRYNGIGNDYDRANDLIVDGGHNVYVTGYSVRTPYPPYTVSDIITIKYSQSVPLDLTLTPLAPPIIIPANGGSFNFNASVVRNAGPQAPYAVWCRIKNPDGTYTPPTLGPVTINTPVGVTITRQRSQTIPGSWPAGVYTYLGYVNTTYAYPAIDSCSFPFTKSATGDGGATVWEATCTGEPFPSEVEGHLAAPISGSGATPTMALSPNPFNPSTTISYQLAASTHVHLTVHNVQGRQVATLVDCWRDAGTHSATFDGSHLPSGIYLAKLQGGNFSSVLKLVLMK